MSKLCGNSIYWYFWLTECGSTCEHISCYSYFIDRGLAFDKLYEALPYIVQTPKLELLNFLFDVVHLDLSDLREEDPNLFDLVIWNSRECPECIHFLKRKGLTTEDILSSCVLYLIESRNHFIYIRDLFNISWNQLIVNLSEEPNILTSHCGKFDFLDYFTLLGLTRQQVIDSNLVKVARERGDYEFAYCVQCMYDIPFT